MATSSRRRGEASACRSWGAGAIRGIISGRQLHASAPGQGGKWLGALDGHAATSCRRGEGRSGLRRASGSGR
eukprot:scaffold9439_cov118-Isochrysis_galbana.AAC.4